MLNIFEKIEKKFKVFKTKPVSDEQIKEAEQQLKVKFSDDYKNYLIHYGAISFGSTELTGLNIDNYANVVNVTLKEKQRDDLFPNDAIVLENTGIEGILILMNENGEVYEWQNGKKIRSFGNFKDYLKTKLK